MALLFHQAAGVSIAVGVRRRAYRSLDHTLFDLEQREKKKLLAGRGFSKGGGRELENENQRMESL